MGLNDIHPFNPEEKIIEFVMAEKGKRKLSGMNLRAFMEETASESPAPGGGSVSAYMGALGSALGTMVANLSSHKKGWDDRWKEFSGWAEKGKAIQNTLLDLVDEDTEAFNSIMEAFRRPKNSDAEKKDRTEAIQAATRQAILVPYKVMETAFSAFPLIREMVEKGNPSSVTDAGVGALALGSCIKGAFLNIRINAEGLDDKRFVNNLLSRGFELEERAVREESDIIKIIESRFSVGRKS
jgi:glutamate formiminotransferase/formiminotetrahydrofolate cyclodeaminase